MSEDIPDAFLATEASPQRRAGEGSSGLGSASDVCEETRQAGFLQGVRTETPDLVPAASGMLNRQTLEMCNSRVPRARDGVSCVAVLIVSCH